MPHVTGHFCVCHVELWLLFHDFFPVPGYLDLGTWVPGYLGTWVPGYLGTWVPGYLGTWVPGYLGTWVPGQTRVFSGVAHPLFGCGTPAFRVSHTRKAGVPHPLVETPAFDSSSEAGPRRVGTLLSYQWQKKKCPQSDDFKSPPRLLEPKGTFFFQM